MELKDETIKVPKINFSDAEIGGLMPDFKDYTSIEEMLKSQK